MDLTLPVDSVAEQADQDQLAALYEEMPGLTYDQVHAKYRGFKTRLARALAVGKRVKTSNETRRGTPTVSLVIDIRAQIRHIRASADLVAACLETLKEMDLDQTNAKREKWDSDIEAIDTDTRTVLTALEQQRDKYEAEVFFTPKQLADKSASQATIAPAEGYSNSSTNLIKPQVLTRAFTAVEFKEWERQFAAWFKASNQHTKDTLIQHEFLFSFIESKIRTRIRADITDKMPVIGTSTEIGVLNVVADNFSTFHPVFDRRIELLRMRPDRGDLISDFVDSFLDAADEAATAEMQNDDWLCLTLSAIIAQVDEKLSRKITKERERLTRKKLMEIVEDYERVNVSSAKIKTMPTSVSNNVVCAAASSSSKSRPKGRDVRRNRPNGESNSTTRLATTRSYAGGRVPSKGYSPEKPLCENCNSKAHPTARCTQKKFRRKFARRRPEHRARSASRGRSYSASHSRGNSRGHSRGRTPSRDRGRKDMRKRSVTPMRHRRDSYRSRARSYAAEVSNGKDEIECSATDVLPASVVEYSENGKPTPRLLVLLSKPKSPRSHRITALPDTGCTRTLVLSKALQTLGIKADKSYRPTIRVANSTTERSDGIVDLQIKLGHASFTTSAVVCNRLPEELMLSWQDCIRLGIIHRKFPEQIRFRETPTTHMSRLAIPPETASVEVYSSEPEDPDLTRLANEFRDVFDEQEITPMAGPPSKVHINRSKPGYRPLKTTTARPVPVHYQREAKKNLEWFIKSGVIERVPTTEHTEWCSPGFFVPKPNGKVRLVVDYREINKYIDRPAHPFPSPRDIIKGVRPDSKWFVKADAVQGYFQIPLDEESQKLTTFLLPEGRFRYTRAPMGMNNSSDVFCERTDQILKSVPDLLKIVDDTLIQAPSKPLALQRLRKLFLACREGNLTLARAKLMMGQELPFAGYIIGEKGVKPDPRRTSAISHFPQPTDQSSLRGFLGLAQQLGFFVPDLAHQTECLRQLLKKNTVFIWDQEHQKAFEKVKSTLTSPLVSAPFDKKKHTTLLTDASRLHGMGYALMQKRTDSSDHQLVQCGSRSLIPAETRYATNELECLAIAWAVKDCRHYLLGAEFTVLTDHRPLVGAFNKPLADIANPRIMRYRETLMCYKFDILYTPGKTHLIADALSRAPAFDPAEAADPEDMVNCAYVTIDPSLQKLADEAEKDNAYLETVQAVKMGKTSKDLPKGHLAQRLKGVWRDISIVEHNILVYDGTRIIPPESCRQEIVDGMHESHPGICRALAHARRDYYWPNMNAEIIAKVQACEKCQSIRPSQSEEVKMYEKATRPMQSVSLDLFHESGHEYLVMVDRFSNFTWVSKLNKTDTSSVTKALEAWFNEHGYPAEIITDNGPQFRTEFANFCNRKKVKWQSSSPYNSQSNGLAESAVKNMKTLMEKSDTFQDFKSRLLEWRNTPSSNSPFSPAEKFYSRRLRTTLPTLHLPPRQQEAKTEEIAEENCQTQRRKLKAFKIGEIVRVQNPITKRWDSKATIRSIQPTTRSYELVKQKGKPFVRNRRFLKRIPSFDHLIDLKKPQIFRSTDTSFIDAVQQSTEVHFTSD